MRTVTTATAPLVQQLLSADDTEFAVVHGRGQYSEQGGASSCGIAAMNCARIVLGKEQAGLRGEELLLSVLRPETFDEILGLCASWSSSAHLDVEDIYETSVFHRSLSLSYTEFGEIKPGNFKTLLRELQRPVTTSSRSSCLVITRPPEIISCFCLGPRACPFVIFDSHPRPKLHPNGAAFICFASLDATAAYLDTLLHVDPGITDGDVQWQAQLLGSFSGHVFVAKALATSADWVDAALEASLQALHFRAEYQQLASRNTALNGEKAPLRTLRSSPRPARADPHGRRYGGANRKQPIASASRASRVGGSIVSDAALARQLERLLNEEQHIHLTGERTSFVGSRLGTFDCGVCMESLSEEFVCEVPGCQHRYCRECIHGHVESELGLRHFPIQCPLCKADRNRREATVLDNMFVQHIGLSEEQYVLFEQLELLPFATAVECRSCHRSFFMDKEEYDEYSIVSCPLSACQGSWCKLCNQPVNPGKDEPKHSCDGANELKHLMDEKGWKWCPGCKTPAEKIDGCNHMACTSPGCNTHFCYVCGLTITHSVRGREIREAVTEHYRNCTMFDHILDL